MDTNPNWRDVLQKGFWCDIWVASVVGLNWCQLTNTSLVTDGIMHPTFSPDGKQLMWSRRIQGASQVYPWGRYRLMLADFCFVSNVPIVSNGRDVTPAGINFIEAGAVSSDGTHAPVSTDIDANQNYKLNVLAVDLAAPTYVNLTKSYAGG